MCCGTSMDINERFCTQCGAKIHYIDNNVYVSNKCPLIVTEIRLTVTTKKEAKLSMTIINNSEKSVEACYVSAKCYGVAGEQLSSLDNYAYLDLDADNGEIFGEDNLIVLPDNNTRTIKPYIEKVVFEDGSILNIGEAVKFERYNTYYDKLAIEAMKNHAYDQALAYTDSAITTNPKNSNAHYRKASLCLKLLKKYLLEESYDYERIKYFTDTDIDSFIVSTLIITTNYATDNLDTDDDKKVTNKIYLINLNALAIALKSSLDVLRVEQGESWQSMTYDDVVYKKKATKQAIKDTIRKDFCFKLIKHAVDIRRQIPNTFLNQKTINSKMVVLCERYINNANNISEVVEQQDFKQTMEYYYRLMVDGIDGAPSF